MATSYVLDKRVGCVAVYIGPKRNCLEGIVGDGDLLFYAPGHRFRGEWIVTPAAELKAERVFAAALEHESSRCPPSP